MRVAELLSAAEAAAAKEDETELAAALDADPAGTDSVQRHFEFHQPLPPGFLHHKQLLLLHLVVLAH